jgi:hypothetical protein
MEVSVSKRARRHIEWNGGEVFVWFSPLGADLFQHVSTKRPAAVQFTRHHVEGFSVFLQADFDPPEKLTITKLMWPFGLEVVGTGVGEFDLGGGGGDGGWPGSHGDGGGGGGGGHGGGGHH